MTSQTANYAGPFFWQNCSATELKNSQLILKHTLQTYKEELVGIFYDHFMLHEDGTKYLSHSVVNERLKYSLIKWLTDLFEFDPHQDMDQFNKRQIKIGEIHARLGIPNILVLEGASLLKTKTALKISEQKLGIEQSTHALILLDEIIDHAMRQMSEAYVTGMQQRAQSDEAFRIVTLGQDINLVRETQRAALMEWAQSTVFTLFSGKDNPHYQPLASSPFGLWIRHRAPMMFRPDYLLHDIDKLISAIDFETIPNIQNSDFQNKDEMFLAVNGLQKKVDELKFVLSDLFQKAADYESGRDPLTRTMNRRFLPSVLQREITLAQQNSSALSLLMLDVDYFKKINDTHGHQAGDTVLTKIADVLTEAIRSTDYLFRYGGEEFLIVLPETDIRNGTHIANRICKMVEQTSIVLADQSVAHITVSIGVAAYDGHPDYEYLLAEADSALYEAKEKGRNRVSAKS